MKKFSEINGLPEVLPMAAIQELEVARAELSKELAGKFSGMKWDQTGKAESDGRKGETAEEDGRSIAEKAADAFWECKWCGHHVQDTASERKQLAETYEQDYQARLGFNYSAPAQNGNDLANNEGTGSMGPREGYSQIQIEDGDDEKNRIATAGKWKAKAQRVEVCFTVPFEAALINRFSASVKDFLLAKYAKELGNDLPLMNWFLSDRAFFYEKGSSAALELAPVIGSYDPREQIPNQHSVNMAVDCQKKLDSEEDVVGSFWIIVEAVDRMGSSRDLYRGFVTSWDEVIALQKRFKIPNGRVVIDGRKWTPAILQKAAECFELSDSLWMGRRYRKRSCWMVLLGDDAAFYRWPRGNGKWIAKGYSMPHENRRLIMEGNRSVSVAVFTSLWSNLELSDQLHEIMLGGEGKPKIETLARGQLDEATQRKEVGDLTYERQINAEYRTVKRGKSYWEKKRPENHYLDCRKMLGVRKMMDGLWGTMVNVDENQKAAEVVSDQGHGEGEAAR